MVGSPGNTESISHANQPAILRSRTISEIYQPETGGQKDYDLLPYIQRRSEKRIGISERSGGTVFEWFEKFCLDRGCAVTVMNAESLLPAEEMTKDLMSIIHCFSSRLYGLRKYNNELQDMISEVER